MTEPSTLTTGSLRVQRTPRWYTGRSELVVVAGVFVLAAFMMDRDKLSPFMSTISTTGSWITRSS